MRDLVYIYNKVTFARIELGEIQTNFNMSFVIDGTKDSTKIIVHSFSGIEVEPYTILKHQNTNTWWVVSHDKVTRYKNENGYYYTHELELLGAIELLNARDLTDSGFNQNSYTIFTFFERLLKLSNFEFNEIYDEIGYPNKIGYEFTSNNLIDIDKVVDYVKTYENYTLLSALRDFFNDYNCVLKLNFREKNDGSLLVANFVLYSRTGNAYKQILNDNIFNEVQEIKTIDKKSFGTTVISNAQNVISTKSKTYPASGLVKPTGTSFVFNGRNGTMVVRLPSQAYKVNYVDMATKTTFALVDSEGNEYKTSFNPFNDDSIQTAFNTIRDKANEKGILSAFDTDINISMLRQIGFRRFYYEDNYNPNAKQFVSDNYIPIRVTSKQYLTPYQTVLSNKEMKENVQNRDNVFYCDRGSDLIEGFTFFGDSGVTKDRIWFKNTNERVILLTHVVGTIRYWVVLGNYEFNTSIPERGPTIDYQEYYIPNIGFSINYIPMSDIKIKLDNNGNTRDSQLYNQNGKLTDSVALSKSLLSYSKEITSDNITKYGAYYTFSNVPSVGDIVIINNQKYVINNVSLDFFENEQNYYIRGEFTLSKAIAVKSLMVNPNQNIRDYGIPQNFNVKRKQLYRDFYELTYIRESTDNQWYLPLSSILNLGFEYKPYQEHTAIMKLTYEEEIQGNSSYYYQLDCTTYRMKKTIYEIVDFKDNNIIGYGSQNVWSGFDITRVISGMTDMVNTPISYVDNFGNVKDIELLFSNNLQLTTIYQQYIQISGASNSNYSSFYSCFIPPNIYNIAISKGKGINYGETVYGYDFDIREIDYNKDATEVPVFEYSCQIDDSDDVIIGDNILDTNEIDAGYVYLFKLAPKNIYDNNNFDILQFQNVMLNGNNIATAQNVAKLEYVNNDIQITLYGNGEYNLNTGEQTFTNEINLSTLDLDDYDLIIVRYRFYNDEISVLSSLSIKTDAHSTVTLSIVRDGVTILDNYVVDRSTTYTRNDLVSTDQYSYTINADFGYMLDNMPSSGYGDLRSPLYLNVKTISKPETTLTIEMSKRITCVIAFTINGVTSYEPVFDGRKIYHIPYGTVVNYYFNNTTNGYNYSTQRETHDYDANTNSWVVRQFTSPISSNNCHKFSNTTNSITMYGDQTIVLTNIGVRRDMVFTYMFTEAYSVPSASFFVIYYNGSTQAEERFTSPSQSLAQTRIFTGSELGLANGDMGFYVGAQVPVMSGTININSRAVFPADTPNGLSSYTKVTDTYTEFNYNDLVEGNKISLSHINNDNLLRLIYVIPND